MKGKMKVLNMSCHNSHCILLISDYIGMFQTLITSFAGILSLMLAKRAAALCDGPECVKAEVAEGAEGPFKKCGQCQRMRYCSRECQVAAWKQGHKLTCQKAEPTTTAA